MSAAYKIIDLEQGSQEWLAWRRGKIGASDAPVIMGVSPWQNLYGLWKEKIDGAEANMTPNMNRGRALENDARDAYIKLRGVFVEPMCLENAEYSWMGASMDGLNLKKGTAVEIKCPSRSDHGIALEGKVPDHYFPQLQHQMKVCDLEKMDYFSFDGENGVIVEVPRDESYVSDLVLRERDFWQRVVDFDPPPLPEDAYKLIDSIEWQLLAQEWKEYDDIEKAATNQKKILREMLLPLSNGKPSRGFGVRVSYQDRQGALDTKKLEEVVDLSQYRKTPTCIAILSREKSS